MIVRIHINTPLGDFHSSPREVSDEELELIKSAAAQASKLESFLIENGNLSVYISSEVLKNSIIIIGKE